MKAYHVLNKKILFFSFLTAFLLVSIVPLLTSSYPLLRKTEEELKSSLNENNYTMASAIAHSLDGFQIEKWISSLRGLSTIVAFSQRRASTDDDGLFNSFFNQINEMVIMSVQTEPGAGIKHYVKGNVLSALGNLPADSLARLFEPHPGPARENGDGTIGESIFFPENRIWFLPIQITLERGTGRPGWCRGVFQLNPAFEFIDTDMSISSRPIYILDGQGRILFQNKYGRFLPGSFLPYPIGTLAGRQSAIFQTMQFDYENQKYLGYVFPTPRTGWRVVVVSPYSKAYTLVSQTRHQILINIGVSLILSLAVSFLFAWFHSSVIVYAKEQLQRYADKLEQSNAELEAFAYTISHDLSAPLRHIMGYTDILEMRLGPNLDPKTQQHLRTISAAARNLQKLIYDVLVFSRLGYDEIHKTRINVESLVRSILEKMEPEIAQRKIRWQIRKCESVWGDQVMIQQAVFNLVSNAIKFTRIRGKTVIEIGTASETDEVVVYVRDNGIGFDMKHKNKLFGLFQRLHEKETYEGSGVGLAHVRRIIAKHGGRTWAEGAVGEGATFFFSLPRETSAKKSPRNRREKRWRVRPSSKAVREEKP